MVWAAVGSSALNLVGGMIGQHSANSAAKTQADAAAAANQAYLEQTKPYTEAGKVGLTNLQTGLTPGGQFTKQFTMADATNSPAEQHALQQGTQAIQNSAAAKGGLINSNVMQGLQEFGQANAALYQNQAFNQWLAQQQFQLGANQNLANMGANVATGNATNSADAILAAGGAKAGGQVASGNIWGNALGQIGNILGQADLFKPTVGSAGVPTSPNSAPINNPSAYINVMGGP